jgi:GntR family transcriptional regulator
MHKATAAPTNELRVERGVSQYHRLADLLRHQIASGERHLGSQLPPLSRLAEDMGIALVTVKNAYDILSKEGIILSQRGRGTYVVKVPSKDDEKLLAAANNNILDADDPLIFKVLSVEHGCLAPSDAGGGGDIGSAFTCIKKVQYLQGTPFSYTIIFIPTAVFRKIPADAVNKQKILGALFLVYEGAKCTIHQRTTIALADQPMSELLECLFAAPVAKMVRNLHDPTGKLLYAGTSWYRSDRFVSDITYPADLLRKVPSLVVASANI